MWEGVSMAAAPSGSTDVQRVGPGRPPPATAWQPGQSGNPSGLPAGVGEVRALARQYTQQAITTLAEIMQDTHAPRPARVAAAEALLDRGWGKPQQQIDVGGGEWAALGAASLAALLASLPADVQARYALLAVATGGEQQVVIDVTPPAEGQKGDKSVP